MCNLPEMRSENREFWAVLRIEISHLGLEDLPQELEFAPAAVAQSLSPFYRG
jgi:hypothetical protein